MSFTKVVMKTPNRKSPKTTKFSRSIPYFRAILKSPSEARWQLLHSLPKFVFDDFLLVLQQIVLGNMDIGKQKWRLQKYKDALIEMAKSASLASKKRTLLKHFPLPKVSSRQKYFGNKNIQIGNGFVWMALIPILAALGKAAAVGAAGAAGAAAIKAAVG